MAPTAAFSDITSAPLTPKMRVRGRSQAGLQAAPPTLRSRGSAGILGSAQAGVAERFDPGDAHH
jgi:hypothetical protein